jgi:hypothetical protein
MAADHAIGELPEVIGAHAACVTLGGSRVPLVKAAIGQLPYCFVSDA